jgi:hypothetical protein
MDEDPDTERIQDEREQRRAAERLRMEEVRRARQLELSRLHEAELHRDSGSGPDRGRRPPRLVIIPGEDEGPTPESSGEGAGSVRAPPEAVPPRQIGDAIPTPVIDEFLRTDPTERFDILTLNTLRFPPVIAAAAGDPAMLEKIARRAEALMLRVKQEVDDPLSAGAFLRDLVLHWYRESPADPEWPRRTPERWAGVFSDSRASGGKLHPWLNVRLWSLHEAALRGGRLREKVRRSFLRDKAAETAAGRTASQQIHAEVAQAILDDLATARREPAMPVPLVRLSELAVRRQVPTVNDALALLFSAPETGPFVVLHPNRYPDCDELQIRPPAAGATGAALAYTLVPGRGVRRGGGRSRGSADGDEREGEPGTSASVEETELDEAALWESETVAPPAWLKVVATLRRERRRLDSPPKDYRTRAAYGPLVDLVFGDGEFRKAFLAVKWRGRPAGLPLLVTLLQKGAIAPEVSTDHEYLEAELGELAQGDSQWRPEAGTWNLRGWTVTREGSHRDGFRYRAEPAT